MAFSEQFYIHIQGEQKGPYTFEQLKRLYDRNLIVEETLYWRDGLEQWQPVSDLCGPPVKARRKERRRKQVAALAVLTLLALLAAYVAPLLRDGWNEATRTGFDEEAAYWKARSFVRDAMKVHGATVSFEKFREAKVALIQPSGAAVSIPGTLFKADGTSVPARWQVTLRYITTDGEWQPPPPSAIQTLHQ